MNISKERLAIFLPGLYDGAAERTLLNLAEGIATRGYPVDLVLSRAEGPYMAEIPDSVRVIDLKAARVLMLAVWGQHTTEVVHRALVEQ